MRRGVLIAGMAIALGIAGTAAVSRADGPEVGANVGTAVAIGKFRRTVDGDFGGTIGFSGGYRWDISDNFALSLVGQPQFIFVPTHNKWWLRNGGGAVLSTAALTAGPKFTFVTGELETSVSAQGGYYVDMGGPSSITDNGAGFNAGLAMNYRVTDDDLVGVYGRWDYAYLHASALGGDTTHQERRQFALAGVGYTHVFRPAEPVVAQAAPPPPPPPPPPPAKRKLVLRGVNFDFDKSNIRSDARPILDEAVSTLKQESTIDVSVEGHTDSVGSDAYNQKLSERRARSVADYLTKGGIAGKRLQTVGFGESQPVASNQTADGRAQNRRVELRVLGQ